MSIFSETKLKIPEGLMAHQVAVSNTIAMPIIAVATRGKVIFYDENGDKLQYEISRTATPFAITWHPKLTVLAIGWETGAVTLCNIKSEKAKDEPNYHQSPVRKIAFNEFGDRMVSVDEFGNIAIWKELNCICAYDKECNVTTITSASIVVKRKSKRSKHLNLFFIGGAEGIVWYANDNRCDELCRLKDQIIKIMFYKANSSVVLMTSKFDLFQFRISVSNMKIPHKRVKLSLSSDIKKIRMEWISPSSFAVTSWDGYVRIWNVENNRNYTLTINDGNQENAISIVSGKIVTCRYNENSQTLYAGTSDGKIMGWRNGLHNVAATSSDQWRNLGGIMLGGQVKNISVGNSGIVAVEYGERLSLLYETKLGGRLTDKYKVLQTSNTFLQIYYKDHEGMDKIHLFDARMNVKCFDLKGNKLLVWNGASCVLCDIHADREQDIVTQCAMFDCAAKFLCFHKDGVVKIMQYMLQVVNFQGIVKQEINFSKSEGEVIGYDYGKGTLITYTSKSFIRNISIAKREVKTVGMIKNLSECIGIEDVRILDLRVNYKGNKVSILVNSSVDQGTTFYVWDMDSDIFIPYQFEIGFEPLGMAWAFSDARFLGVYGVFNKEGHIPVKKIFTFFVTKKHELKKHDEKIEANIEGIFAIQAPYILGISKNNSLNADINYTLNNIFMRQFSGANMEDPTALASIMDFNYHLTEGNMDLAHKSIKHIDSAEIWKNMAQMSIKTRRVDVALTCIANMKFARGAKALREMETTDEMSQLAAVAILLNMLEEAESLLKEAKRYDLLNQLYQNENDWDKALNIAESHDRIHLNLTYYKAAQNSELHKNFDEAINFFEKSQTGEREIPRMLSGNQQFNKLEEYASANSEKKVLSFQGQVYQTYDDYETSKKYFQKAEDYGSIVQMELENMNIDAAEQICNQTSDTLACFWVAKHHEDNENPTKALEFYKKGRHYSHCIRLARAAGEDEEVYSSAIQAPKYVQCRAARYFEKKGYVEKAVILFMKGKNFKRALDLATANNLTEYIQKIIAEIDKQETDTRNLGNLAERFVEQGDVEKAFSMFLGSGHNEKALELLERENITLDKKSVKQLLPPKDEDPVKREQVIRILAKRLAEQNKCDVAAKLYIEVKEPILALKAVIKGGDPQKVIKFANFARSAEAYVLAANFLQNADWHNNQALISKITLYYRKAKKYDSLANFFVSLAMLEIDEYKNYEKALQATKEAKKFASHGHNTALIAQLDSKIEFISKFIQAKEKIKTDADTATMELKELTDDPDAKDCLRIGDVYATLFEHYVNTGKNNEAWDVVEDMKKKKYQVTRYLDLQYLEKVSEAVGKRLGDDKEEEDDDISPWDAKKDDPEDDINDDIVEEFQF